MEIIFDWFSFTLKNMSVEEVISDVLQVPLVLFEDTNGRNGYKDGFSYGGLYVYYNGRPDMGVLVQVSGDGCRLLESMQNFTWKFWLKVLFTLEAHFTRLDIAIDEYEDYLNLDRIWDYCSKCNVVSPFKSVRNLEERSIADFDKITRTINFGDRSSRVYIRIYDKALQKGIDSVWNRLEIEFKQERCQQVLLYYLNNDVDLGFLAFGCLNTYLRFVDDDDTNRSRKNNAIWWDDFLLHTKKIKLTVKKPEITIERKKKWLENSVSTTLNMVFECTGRKRELFDSLILDGQSRMKDKHRRQIEQYKKSGENIFVWCNKEIYDYSWVEKAIKLCDNPFPEEKYIQVTIDDKKYVDKKNKW